MSRTGQKALVVGGLALAGIAAIAVMRRDKEEAPATAMPPASDELRPQAKDPRMILSRIWLDKLPRKRTDEFDLWIFLAGGIGLEEKGSRWRFTFDVFDLERQGSKLDIVFLQDKKKQNIKFEVVSCSDKPPFDLCLDLSEPLRGQKRLWSWDDDGDMDSNMPWGRELRTTAAAHAQGSRGQ
jgi:hypothetical protein